MSRDTLYFDAALREHFEPYLPHLLHASPPSSSDGRGRPFVTLTYAASLDSRIAAAPGRQTMLSGRASKSMTHFLRTRHDAILVGSGTAIADNPTLNSRLNDASHESQPRPIVLDRRARWHVSAESKVVQAATQGLGKAPWVLVDPAALNTMPASRREALEACGGRYMAFSGDWPAVFDLLLREGVTSLMIEGGAQVINAMLTSHPSTIDSIIITMAPVFLGSDGVVVSPSTTRALSDVRWLPLENDAVMCARTI